MSSPFPAGQRLYDSLFETLGRKIVTQQIAPGELLSPDATALEYSVSRSVVREVFRTLEDKGLVVARPRIGTRVTAPADWDFLDPSVLTWRLESGEREKQVADLFHMRSAIEPIAARLAAMQPGIASTILTLGDSVTAMRAAFDAKQVHQFTAADITFHTALLRASGNTMFVCLQKALEIAILARETVFVPFTDRTVRGLELHVKLVEDLKRAAASDAEGTMRNLLSDAHEEVERGMHADSSSAPV